MPHGKVSEGIRIGVLRVGLCWLGPRVGRARRRWRPSSSFSASGKASAIKEARPAGSRLRRRAGSRDRPNELYRHTASGAILRRDTMT